MSNKNQLAPGNLNRLSRLALAADLQDAWHYATFICPVPGSESTFTGSREYRGIGGLARAYQDLTSKIYALEYNFPAFLNLQMRDAEDFNTVAELRQQVRKIFKAVLIVAEANNIDAYAGEAR